MSMPYNLPQRKSPRATWHDYNGANYFITICTKHHELYFGDVVDGRMELSEIGEWAMKQIEQTAIIRQNDVEIPLFVVMPNHIHLIVVYNNANAGRTQYGGRTRCVPTCPNRPLPLRQGCVFREGGVKGEDSCSKEGGEEIKKTLSPFHCV